MLGLVTIAVALIVWPGVGLLDGSAGISTVAFISIFIVTALAYSTMYQVTVKLNLWRLGFESVDFTGLAALDSVKAVAQSSTAMGEGLADALSVGSY